MNSKIIPSLVIIGAGITFSACRNPDNIKPNVIFVFADEWRAQDVGYFGNEDVLTPNLDKLSKESINIRNAVSGCPVSSPYRGSLLTGQYPLTHGVFVNDVMLDPGSHTMPKVFKSAGYETAYIGKWHLDGHGRSSFIPEERRHGFEYWKVLECTHNYFNSSYWDNNDEKKKWKGYDAEAQTADAIQYIQEKARSGKPFFLILSWGPPHTPFETAPEDEQQLFRNKQLKIRLNVPETLAEKTQKDLEGYYGHISALDKCIGKLNEAIRAAGLERNTIFVFTSDHGNMINSHGMMHKQKPYEESVLVPFLIRYPAEFGKKGKSTDLLMNTPDIMPTLLSLCGLDIPGTVEGDDLSGVLAGKQADKREAVLISCPHPFGQWSKKSGGREYRGVRTKQYTYASDLNGPWILFDNTRDPYQLNNLVEEDDYKQIREKLQFQLDSLLKKTNDKFLPGMKYIEKWNYLVNENGTVPYDKINYKGVPVE